ncbi:MAG: polysaccharide deacetylase family protein [Plesiomonas sp.]|uniref:polysaccharide deacetylase family protein n=1 Tax=Plesiomonas sp. TaxID=2486279 RepID=UPI003F40B5F4
MAVEHSDSVVSNTKLVFNAAVASEKSAISTTAIYTKAITEAKTPVYAKIAGHEMQVLTLNKGQSIDINTVNNGDYQINFGNAFAIIHQSDLNIVKKDKIDRLLDTMLLQEKQEQHRALDNIITKSAVPIYNEISYKPTVFAYLSEGLRYPFVDKIEDSNNVSWYVIRIAGEVKYIKASDVELDHGIAVLTFHHILTNQENKLFRHTSTTTSDVAFSNQMAYLQQAGYQTVSMEDLEGYIKGKINLPARVVVLTFDDGLKSVYKYAYPILKKYKFKATAFIISSRIKYFPQPWDANSLQFLSFQEIDAMQDVFEIESHTHFMHKRVLRHPVLLSKSYHNIYRDFVRSKKVLRKYNYHVDYLSYPFGGYNKMAIKAAKEAGYHLAVTTEQGKVKPNDNPYTLKRLYVFRTDPVQVFADKIRN